MKILLAADDFYPHTGGVSEHMYYLWQCLKKMGHDARVIAPSFGNNEPYVDKDIIRMGRGILIPKNKSFSVLNLGLVTIPWKLRRLFDKENFDIIHIHGPLAPVLPYYTLKYSRTVNFVTCHAAHSDSLGYILWEPVLEQYFRKISGLIAVSEVARDSISKYFPGNYRLIPNGIDTERFKPDNETIPYLDKFSPKILFVGRFEPRKGLKYLLKACPTILKAFPEAKFIIVGSGVLEHYYRSYMDEYFEEHVIFTGHVSPDELPKYYASCDLFCSPATGAESFGIVLLEAMASGKPVLAADIPGYRTVMQDNEEGLFFTVCNAGSLADKAVELLKDRKRMKQMGLKGRKRAMQYDWSKVTKKVVDYYSEVLRSKG
jgi:phosphatidylinositol alpha-mannosyltransferase